MECPPQDLLLTQQQWGEGYHEMRHGVIYHRKYELGIRDLAGNYWVTNPAYTLWRELQRIKAGEEFRREQRAIARDRLRREQA